MKKSALTLFAILVLAFAAALAAHAKGLLPCMVYRHGLTNEQIDDILTRHPDAQLRITAQDWRAMRYQLHRFGNMTNYVEQIGGSNDCARLLLSLDDRVTELRTATNRLENAASMSANALSRMEADYASSTNSYAILKARYDEAIHDFQTVMHDTVEKYNAATNSLAVAEARAARADALKAWLEAQRDKSPLQTTKKIYQAIIDKLEE